MPDYVITDIKLALLNFKYWFDEAAESDREQEIKGKKDLEMTFWSENHQAEFYQAQCLAGALFSGETFAHASLGQAKPVTGADLQQRGEARMRKWLDHRLAFGFSEWNSPVYLLADFPALFNLADFSKNAELQTKASMMLDRLIFDLGRFTCRGSFGVSAGRAYFEHKCYGWEQAIGDTIEILFGTRGDFVDRETPAIYLATTTYEAPPALLAVGLDREYQDRPEPFTDRTRISINLDEGGDYGIGVEDDDDIVYWWGNTAYFTNETIEATRRLASDHDHLEKTNPFMLMFPSPDLPWYAAVVSLILDLIKTPIAGDVVETVGGAALASAAGTGVLLPFPLNLLAGAFTVTGLEMELSGIFQFVADLIKTGVRAIEKLFGGGDANQPVIPESSVVSALEDLLIAFNKGSTLTRVNEYTYSNGDAMLSSIQDHLKGEIAFQKHAWEATLDCEACVWTTAPMTNLNSFLASLPASNANAWLEFFKDLGQFEPLTALATLAAPSLVGIFGHDGPNYWTGTFALPMIVQWENAAIVAYNVPNLQRALSATETHAWFPKAMFNEVEVRPKDGGTWVFGRKGAGFVALYSARPVNFTSDGPWKDKELIADGSTNVWICVVGNTTTFGVPAQPSDGPGAADERAFANFKDQVSNAYLHVSGLGSVAQVECSFDIPGAEAPPGRSPRLELFYSGETGRFAGDDLPLDDYPKFRNKYVDAKWGETSYTITHPQTNLALFHDLKAPRRTFDRQAAAASAAAPASKDLFQRPVIMPFRQQIRDAMKLAKK